MKAPDAPKANNRRRHMLVNETIFQAISKTYVVDFLKARFSESKVVLWREFDSLISRDGDVSIRTGDVNNRAALFFLLGLTVVALYFCYILFAPFLRPIGFSAIIAVLFYPLHSRILHRLRKRNVSALLSTLVIAVIIVCSAVFLGRALATGLRDIYQSMSNSGDGGERLGILPNSSS